MTTIYLVNGCVHYEFHTTICAFTEESKADDFIIQCEKYDKLKPPKSSKRMWEDNHPAGYTKYDFYEVEEITLK